MGMGSWGRTSGAVLSLAIAKAVAGAGCRVEVDDLRESGRDAEAPEPAKEPRADAAPTPTTPGITAAMTEPPDPAPPPPKPDVNAAGDYSAIITNGQNGCEFPNWIPGQDTRDVRIRITQVGRGVSASVEGAAGLALDWGALGGHVYTGEVAGNRLRMQLHGQKRDERAGCAFTIDSFVDAWLEGDWLSGTVRYERVLSDDPACAPLRCTTEQALNATRPKQP